jgi:transposase-like protein
MLTALPDDKACREYLELMRWNGTPTCPHCGVVDANHYKLNVKGEFKGMYKCKSCKQRFTVTLGTMFEGSPISLRKWFIAMFLFSAHKKGVSSHQLARDLDVTQKTAWFMLHRLRLTFADTTNEPIGGEGVIVETDTTYIGGKTSNMSKNKRREMKAYPWHNKWDNKTVVTGYIERGGNLRIDVKQDNENVPDMLVKHVEKGSFLMTDDTRIYNRVAREIMSGHEQVNHTNEEYVRDGYIHTNTIEGVFSLFDRMVIGIYHSITPKHMQAYCNEFAFRHNSRKGTDKARFDMALVKTQGAQLKYATLIAK